MSIVRTVIVDDSAFVRKIVREMLSSSPLIEVVGMARNGEDALQVVEEMKPDVVTCDLTMPGVDGVEFVRRQMEKKPVPILILTASPQDGGRVLETLQLGAVDFVQKPSTLANDDLLDIRQELIDKVLIAAKVPLGGRVAAAADPRQAKVAKTRAGPGNVEIVVLGISTGGPQALRFLIPQFGRDFPAALVIVLHMPIGYTAIFAEKLAEICQMEVKEAFEGCAVKAGSALLAPAGQHLSFKRTSSGIVTHLSDKPWEKTHRPSADVLFASAAQVYGNRVLGVVMTGMGDDGKEGAGCIKAAGGTILTESEESCIIYGMPRTVVEAGLSDKAVSLQLMAGEITKRL